MTSNTHRGLLLRPATDADIPALRRLIPRSVRSLSRTHYSDAQIESAIRHVFGLDTQLIVDGTYFVAEVKGDLAGCGGWSRRRTLYGGDQAKSADDSLLDPRREAARIRAFFVDPAFARQGVGSAILTACIAAATAQGFADLELMSTLPGVALYRSFGFTRVSEHCATFPDGETLPIVLMRRATLLNAGEMRCFEPGRLPR